MHVIGGDGDLFFKIMQDNIGEYEYLRDKKKIKVKYVGSENQKTLLLKSKGTRPLFNYRVLPGLFTGLVNTNIWEEHIGFNLFGSPVTSFVVRNKEMAKSYQGFFNTLWNIGKE